MTLEVFLYIFKPGANLAPGRSGNKSQMTTIRVSRAEYADLLKRCGAHSMLRSLARDASRSLPQCALGESWTETVLAATRIAVTKFDEEQQAHADANNAAYIS